MIEIAQMLLYVVLWALPLGAIVVCQMLAMHIVAKEKDTTGTIALLLFAIFALIFYILIDALGLI